MRIVSLTELKNSLSSIVATLLKTKEQVLVCDRDDPIVVIGLPTALGKLQFADKIASLEQHGVLFRGSAPSLSGAALRSLQIKPHKAVDLVQALIDDRKEGR